MLGGVYGDAPDNEVLVWPWPAAPMFEDGPVWAPKSIEDEGNAENAGGGFS